MVPADKRLPGVDYSESSVLLIQRGNSFAAVGMRGGKVAYEILAPGAPADTFQFLKDALK